MACCGAARRSREQATSLQVAAQQDAERQAQQRADDLALTVRVAAEAAVAEYAAPEGPVTGKVVRKRRARVRPADPDVTIETGE